MSFNFQIDAQDAQNMANRVQVVHDELEGGHSYIQNAFYHFDSSYISFDKAALNEAFQQYLQAMDTTAQQAKQLSGQFAYLAYAFQRLSGQ
jgi:hypothetical protein